MEMSHCRVHIVLVNAFTVLLLIKFNRITYRMTLIVLKSWNFEVWNADNQLVYD